MRRSAVYLLVSILTFVAGVSSEMAFSRAADSLVDTLYLDIQLHEVSRPKLHGNCYTYTPRARVVDEKGRTYCVGGEKVRIPGCYE